MSWLPLKFLDMTGYSYVVLQSILALTLMLFWKLRASSGSEGEEVWGADEDTDKDLCGKRLVVTFLFVSVSLSVLNFISDYLGWGAIQYLAVLLFAGFSGIFSMIFPVKYKFVYVFLGMCFAFGYSFWFQTIYEAWQAQQVS